jgi:drug/metabolite transporter (DMT)-like permease
MYWLYALTSGFFISGSTLVEKKILKTEHALEYSVTFAVCNALLSAPLAFFIDFSKVGLVPLVIIFFVAIGHIISALFLTKATRHMEISVVSPIMILAPGITAALAFFVLGETLTRGQVGGIALLLAGLYALEMRPKVSLRESARAFSSSRYMHFLLAAVVMQSFGAIADRYILTQYTIGVIGYLFFAQLFSAFHLLVLSLVRYDGFREVARGFRDGGWWMILGSALIIISRLSLVQAISMGSVGLVTALKRMSGLFTALVGGELFHEDHLLQKSLASLIMIGGVLLITLS